MSAPVSFTIDIVNEDNDTENGSEEENDHVKSAPDRQKATPSASLFSFFACMDGQISCLESARSVKATPIAVSLSSTTASQGSDVQPSSVPKGSYVPISADLYHAKTLHVASKPPSWNTEMRQYTQNYGGRVRMASQKNFAALHVNYLGNVGQFYSSAIEDQIPDQLCLRHGKVSKMS